MINIIVELSKYLLAILVILYTLQCFQMFRKREEHRQGILLGKQLAVIVLFLSLSFLVMFLKSGTIRMLLFYGQMLLYVAAVQVAYRMLYKKASMLLVNNMCMLLSIGLVILCRLNMEKAQRQFMIVAAGSALALAVPVMIRKMQFLKKLTWIYAAVGVVMLAAVFVLGRTTFGAKLTLFGVQPSEFIKIIFVFFMASLLWKDASFPQVVRATIVAGMHVLILVMSRDLGSAVVFFITYLVMIYVVTRKPLYFVGGMAGGAVASVIAYFLFGHVRQRVTAWKRPFSVYEQEGYQIVQSMFAIGT